MQSTLVHGGTNLSVKLKIMFFYLLLFITGFMCLRLILVFFVAEQYFAGMSVSSLFLAVLNGMRFDISLLVLFFMPLQFFLLLPINSKKYIKLLFMADCLVFLTLLIATCGDVVFFGMFGKHVSSEALTARGNMEFLVPYIFNEFWYIILLVLVVAVLLLYGGFRYIDKNFQNHKISFKPLMVNIVVILIVAFVSVVAQRGKISFYTVPLRVIDAEMFGNQKMADISLTGMFSAYEYMRKFKNIQLRLPEDVAEKIAADYFIPKAEHIDDPEYKFMRRRVASSFDLKDKNIVIIFFESWDKVAMEKYPEAVRNFEKLKLDGLYFSNFYTMGSRSLLGITSFLFSIPYVPGLPYINGGLEINNFPRIAGYFNRLGYDTIFVQTDTKSAERMVGLTSYMGFKEFYSKEDIVVPEDKYPDFYKGFDWEGFEFLFDKLNSVNGKFFSVFYTSSTHSPYDAVLSEQYAVTEGLNQYEKFVNRLAYADAALGNFFDKASTMPWFRDTVFILFSDHNAIFSGMLSDDPTDVFKSFMLVYAPDLIPSGESQTVVAQDDILATVIDIAGITENYTSTGRSVFDKDRKNYKYIFGEDGNIYFINGGGESTIINISKLQAIETTNMDEVQYSALAVMESLYRTISKDKWMQKPR